MADEIKEDKTPRCRLCLEKSETEICGACCIQAQEMGIAMACFDRGTTVLKNEALANPRRYWSSLDLETKRLWVECALELMRKIRCMEPASSCKAGGKDRSRK
jgi:hypothetical protein